MSSANSPSTRGTEIADIEVPKKQGAFDFGIPGEGGNQKLGVEGGRQSQKTLKREEREIDWGPWIY